MRRTAPLAAAAIALFAAVPALAHHPLGEVAPIGFAQGLASGIGHPMLGVDHLAFLLAMGLVAAMLGRVFSAPLAFLGASALGVLGAAAGIGSAVVEPVVAVSVVAAGWLALRGRAPGAAVALGLFALAGVAHGLAFGGAIVGAGATPLVGYLLGLALVQYALAAGTGLIAARLWAERGQGAMATRLAGAAAAGVGATILFQMAEGLVVGLLV